MGTQKLLLPFESGTVVGTVVQRAVESGVDGVLVVLGSDRGRVRRTLRSLPVKFTINRDFRQGMLSSIQTAFSALPEAAEAAVVMLGDQPAIPAEVIDNLIKAYRAHPGRIVVPVHDGHRGHPVVISAHYRQEILGLDPKVGLRQLLRNHPDDVLEVTVTSPAILKDLDSPGDYAAEISGRTDRLT
jgi:molybdenum cofactor cytidylyltransferase